MMKLRLLLCYALAVSTVCLAVDEEELEETADEAEIVSNPIEAMGQAPRVVAKRVSQGTSSGFVNTGTDPYANAQQSVRVEIPTGDPYAKSVPKVEVTVGDPYAASGMMVQQELPKALPVPIKKAKKVAPKKKKTTKSSLNTLVVSKADGSKALKKEPFVPREQLTLTSALFKSVSGDDTITNEAQAAVRAIESEVRSRESKIKAVAEESLVSVKREISEQAEQLREQADEAARALKTKTESQVQALLETAEDRIKHLNSVVVQESVKLKQEAAKKALVVIDDMEQRAAQRRVEERKKMLAMTFGLSESELTQGREPSTKDSAQAAKVVKKSTGPVAAGVVPRALLKQKVATASTVPAAPAVTVNLVPASTFGSSALRVSAEWKNDISRRFYQDMSTMKDIIVAAESPVEANDFLKKFEEQNKWFDLTLRSTRQVTDDLYSQLVAKQSQMNRLMSSQRIADEYLNKFTKNMIMDPVQVKKMRLGVLYELNARMQQRSSHLDRTVRESALPEEEIKTLVKRTLSDTSQQFREIAAQFPDVELGSGASRKPQLSLAAVPLRAQQLEEELGEVRAHAEATKQELEQTQQLLIQAQKGLTETQEVVKKTEEVLEKERLAKEKLAAQNTNITNSTFELLGRQTREAVETELAMTGVRQDSDLLKGELAKATTQNVLLKAQKSSLVGAVENARKDALNNTLQRSEDVHRAQKTTMVVQRQARAQIRQLKESGAKVELGLTADLRQAHEKIAHLSVKQAKLVRELEQQRQATATLKVSLRAAQEEAGRSSAQAVLAERARGDSVVAMKRQSALREQAEKRAKMTEELAQQTIDSINGFLKVERKSLTETRKLLVNRDQKLTTDEHEENLGERQNFLEAYRGQLERDRDMLEGLKVETRKVVQHSADLSDELSDDFVKMQEQIENELRQAQQETKRELLVAQERFDKMNDGSNSVNAVKKLASDASEEESDAGEMPKPTVSPTKKAVMPGVKQLALKQQAARMPGLASQPTSARSL
jgi:1,2-phenylacetyl-CoA epoxidase PaaB subunit